MARKAHEISNELWRDGKGWVLITVSAGWFLSIGVRFTYPRFFRSSERRSGWI